MYIPPQLGCERGRRMQGCQNPCRGAGLSPTWKVCAGHGVQANATFMCGVRSRPVGPWFRPGTLLASSVPGRLASAGAKLVGWMF